MLSLIDHEFFITSGLGKRDHRHGYGKEPQQYFITDSMELSVIKYWRDLTGSAGIKPNTKNNSNKK